jgi:alkylated DNA nucleotide flippase Atl1
LKLREAKRQIAGLMTSLAKASQTPWLNIKQKHRRYSKKPSAAA